MSALVVGIIVALVLGGAIFGRSPLGLLNFLVLQWFGVRLARRWVTAAHSGGVDKVRDGWALLRWIWPLTGWWAAYRGIPRGPVPW